MRSRAAATTAGSSPLARGLPGPLRLRRKTSRIIPARAGFTRRRWRPAVPSRDHPRSRGVYSMSDVHRAAILGSSPLARGLPSGLVAGSLPARIIPARAGFTGRREDPARRRRDHPRSRGVYRGIWDGLVNVVGSSPLARGLPPHTRWVCCPARIIPARAGFTHRPRRRGRRRRDHPRSRGVYLLHVPRWLGPRGSSPLARGLPDLHDKGWGPVGIIPARAGFTICACGSPISLRDHPRSRGVYGGGACARAATWGSSPLARGLHPPQPAGAEPGGIIPARAGFTLADPWNPNEPVLYQTPVAFTADLGPAPPSCGSAAVVLRWTTTPSGA